MLVWNPSFEEESFVKRCRNILEVWLEDGRSWKTWEFQLLIGFDSSNEWYCWWKKYISCTTWDVQNLYFCRISEPSAVWPFFTFNQSYRAPAGYIPGWSGFKGLNRPMVTKGAEPCRADGYPHVTPLITGDFGPTGCRHLNTQSKSSF